MEGPFFHELRRQVSSYLTGKISRGRTHPSIRSPSYFCIPTPPPSPTPSHTHSHELADNSVHTPKISSERRSMIKRSARGQDFRCAEIRDHWHNARGVVPRRATHVHPAASRCM